MQGEPSARCVAGRLHSQIDLISMEIRSTRRSRPLRADLSSSQNKSAGFSGADNQNVEFNFSRFRDCFWTSE
jgi:hypothetical protein